jgi:tetratricopeptide (TPR) repeat protein
MLYISESPHRISLFTSFSYIQDYKNNYTLESVLGFGTGALTSDSHNYTESNLNDADLSNLEVPFFLSFKLRTPLMQSRGGLDFLFEYDGGGLNIGASIPLNPAWKIKLAITNFGEISKFGEWNQDGTILSDAPALGIGIQMNIPKLKYKKVKSSVNDLSSIYNQIPYDESVDSLVRHATVLITALEDSLAQQIQTQDNLQSINQSLNQHINYLEDSLSMVLLDDKIVQLNLNQSMKHLSQSLAHYYTQNYKDALEETDKAIALFPGLAIAYARKGSIYYRLGDEQRATVNWNIALTLDPEYDEVRTVLMILQNNKDLKSVILPE